MITFSISLVFVAFIVHHEFTLISLVGCVAEEEKFATYKLLSRLYTCLKAVVGSSF